jgi:uncharacterized protein YcfL
MKKGLFFVAIAILIFTNCNSNKQFIENSDLLYEKSDLYYEDGKETIFISKSNVLFLIDGKKVNEKDVKSIKPNDIESVNVIKDKKEIAKYSSENYDGIIIIKLKK